MVGEYEGAIDRLEHVLSIRAFSPIGLLSPGSCRQSLPLSRVSLANTSHFNSSHQSRSSHLANFPAFPASMF
jgi:hypothetical protein